MKVLVSFCNSIDNKYKNNICEIDIEKNSTTWIYTHEKEEQSVLGMYSEGDKLYSASVFNGEAYLTVRQKEKYQVIEVFKLGEVRDPHSLVVDKEYIYVVSTGTDSVERYILKQGTIIYDGTLWKASDEELDTHHLNGMCIFNGKLYVSGFGVKTNDRWSSAKNGFIYSINDHEYLSNSIYHPHSVVANENGVYCCESSSRSIILDGQTLFRLEMGYLRGLSIREGTFVCGTSNGRKVSKHTGIVNNPADPGEIEPNCKVIVAKSDTDSNSLHFEHEFDFTHVKSEIYDIVHV